MAPLGSLAQVVSLAFISQVQPAGQALSLVHTVASGWQTFTWLGAQVQPSSGGVGISPEGGVSPEGGAASELPELASAGVLGVAPPELPELPLQEQTSSASHVKPVPQSAAALHGCVHLGAHTLLVSFVHAGGASGGGHS